MALRSPILHRLALKLRELLIPYRRAEGLTRYQARAVHKFAGIARNADGLGEVLEIGSDEQGAVAAHLLTNGALQVVGINPSATAWRTARASSKARLVRADARVIPIASDSVDAIFSVATFEHIKELGLAMREFFRVLRAGGILFTDFGPIWSSSVGHHVYANVGSEEARHWKPGLNPVPAFGHLLYSPTELRAELEGRCSPELADAVIEWIHRGESINRLFFEDYLEIFEASPFRLDSLVAVTERVDADVMSQLKEMHPGYRRFDARMVEAVFQKASDSS